MPDEAERPAVIRGRVGGRRVIDLADDLAYFVGHFPKWVGDDGLPLSWRHYVIAMRHANRESARETLREWNAARMAWAGSGDALDEWLRVNRATGGLSTNG